MPAVSLGLVLVSFRGQNNTPTQGMSPLCFLRVDRVQADIPRLPPSPDSVVTCNTELTALQNPPSPELPAALLTALPEPAGALSCSSKVFFLLVFCFFTCGPEAELWGKLMLIIAPNSKPPKALHHNEATHQDHRGFAPPALSAWVLQKHKHLPPVLAEEKPYPQI